MIRLSRSALDKLVHKPQSDEDQHQSATRPPGCSLVFDQAPDDQTDAYEKIYPQGSLAFSGLSGVVRSVSLLPFTRLATRWPLPSEMRIVIAGGVMR